MVERKKPRRRRGWVVVYTDGEINPLLWRTRAKALLWADGDPNARAAPAILALSPPPRPKRKTASPRRK